MWSAIKHCELAQPMREPKNLPQVIIMLKELGQWKDRIASKNQDFNGLKIFLPDLFVEKSADGDPQDKYSDAVRSETD